MSNKIKNALLLGISRAVDELSTSGALDDMAWEAVINIADVIILPSRDQPGRLDATAVLGRKEKLVGFTKIDKLWSSMVSHWGKDYVREMLTEQLKTLEQ